MRTTKVIKETTIGNRSHVTEARCDDPAQAIAAVERLNGRDRSTVVFDANDATVMTIGGGNDGRYVVFIASEIDAALLNLTTPEASADETIELVAGGQRGRYPARQCVDRATATQAAACFVSTGGADPRLC
ncbi:Imm1 family immunity protein [Burkholderia catarinensis]|uniref:Imm1 family immunity protein n=1 Tax=Burkholderia catarinensis TaxID=1108140 RepID=UPI00091F02D1|nr:Imm1 family immunity protein [Burkholderia catarinensis]KAG8150167.1 hypothetical protein BFF94_028165 [Burkholderia catarinensis]